MKANNPTLVVEFDRGWGDFCVRVSDLDPDDVVELSKQEDISEVFRVSVDGSEVESVSGIFGAYECGGNQVTFFPHFPFERKLGYTASFNLNQVHAANKKSMRLAFSIPASRSVAASTEVINVYPTCDDLPENLLRFYVVFSSPMRRGQAQEQVELLTGDGEPVLDALYRAPVELWDSSMTRLTVLLDPGRLKRLVGPNVKLGPPLREGHEYVLQIGSGLLDLDGRPLQQAFRKRFRVEGPIRKSVSVEDWRLTLPIAESRGVLSAAFPEPLDWGLLTQAIAVRTLGGAPVDGIAIVDDAECRWRFEPESNWEAGRYCLRIAAGLEDPCGNSVIAPFDGPLQQNRHITSGSNDRHLFFEVQ